MGRCWTVLIIDQSCNARRTEIDTALADVQVILEKAHGRLLAIKSGDKAAAALYRIHFGEGSNPEAEIGSSIVQATETDRYRLT